MKFRIFISSMALFLIPFSLYAASISPATIDVQASRGETAASKFTVINTSAMEQNYFLGTMEFQPRDESGAPQFLSTQKKNSLTSWIQFPADHITVPAKSKLDVPFNVIVPADVASGSYDAAITVGSAPSDIVATNGAIVEAKTATLVFLTVKGESIKKAALLDFKMSSKNSIVATLDQTFDYRIQNQGNVYFVPTGSIVIKDIFGRTIRSMNANIENGRVLPNSTRQFTVVSGENPKGFLQTIAEQTQDFAIGPITANLDLNLGDGFAPIHATTTFISIPYQLLLTILILVAIIWFAYRETKKRFTKKL